jgi:hypothetical protein
MEYVLENLEDRYELELDRIVEEIRGSEVRSLKAEDGRRMADGGELKVGGRGSGEFKVLLQLPDGLKPWGPVLVDYIEERVAQRGSRESGAGSRGVSVFIWLGDCFGACDLPDSSCDLVVQFGHSEWS